MTTVAAVASRIVPRFSRGLYARNGSLLFGIIGATMLIGGIALWILLGQQGEAITGLPVVAITSLIGVGAFGILRNIFGPAYHTALTWIMPVLPAIVSIAAVGAYLGGLAGNGTEAVFDGIVAAVSVWFVFAAVGLDRTKASGAQERAYAELDVTINQLRGRLSTIPKQTQSLPGYKETLRALKAAEDDLCDDEPSPQWASAIGYINVWRTVHRAEESLIDIDAMPAIVAGALIDDLRLDGSAIPGGPRLIEILHRALWELDPAAAGRYLPASSVPANAKGVPTPDPENYRPRAMLRAVRRAINDFRDARTEDLVKSRNLLRRTFGFAALVTAGLICIAVMGNISKVVVAGGTGLFLVAALVGLFSRLRNTTGSQSTVDDYGLNDAQLLAGPLVSGIAGIGGVVLIAAAPVAAAALSTVNAGAGALTPTLDFVRIFDLSENPLAVVFAAIFGLTPDLLLSQLRRETERVKSDLRSSYVADKSTTPATPNDATPTAR